MAGLILAGDSGGGLPAAHQIVEQVGVEAQSREDADQTAKSLRIVAGVFQRLPGTFQKHPMLGIHEVRFFWVYAKKRGVEIFGVCEYAAGFDVFDSRAD